VEVDEDETVVVVVVAAAARDDGLLMVDIGAGAIGSNRTVVDDDEEEEPELVEADEEVFDADLAGEVNTIFDLSPFADGRDGDDVVPLALELTASMSFLDGTVIFVGVDNDEAEDEDLFLLELTLSELSFLCEVVSL
jgi:hypothetical protein